LIFFSPQVVPDGVGDTPLSSDIQLISAGLQEYSKKLELMGVQNETCVVKDTIVQFVQSKKIDMLVIGNTKKGLIKRTLFGSVTDNAVRDAGCTVVVVKTLLPQSPEQSRANQDANMH